MERKSPQPLEIFYCYARKDHALRDKLDAHLATLHRTGLITAWYDGEIVPGVAWEEEIKTHLNTADIILLLISPAFIQSDYCYSKEMKRALERHDAKEARVVPILLRPVEWAGTPFSLLQMLPSNARPVTRWPDRDEAFKDVAKGIHRAVNELLSQSDLSVSAAPTNLPSQAILSEQQQREQIIPSEERQTIAEAVGKLLTPYNSSLKEERQKLGLTQDEVANRLGVSVSLIERWEKGITVPSSYILKQLCSFFGKSADELGFSRDRRYRIPSDVEWEYNKIDWNRNESREDPQLAREDEYDEGAEWGDVECA